MNKQYRLQRIETSWYQRARVRCHDLFDKNNFDIIKNAVDPTICEFVYTYLKKY